MTLRQFANLGDGDRVVVNDDRRRSGVVCGDVDDEALILLDEGGSVLVHVSVRYLLALAPTHVEQACR